MSKSTKQSNVVAVNTRVGLVTFVRRARSTIVRARKSLGSNIVIMGRKDGTFAAKFRPVDGERVVVEGWKTEKAAYVGAVRALQS